MGFSREVAEPGHVGFGPEVIQMNAADKVCMDFAGHIPPELSQSDLAEWDALALLQLVDALETYDADDLVSTLPTIREVIDRLDVLARKRKAA